MYTIFCDICECILCIYTCSLWWTFRGLLVKFSGLSGLSKIGKSVQLPQRPRRRSFLRMTRILVKLHISNVAKPLFVLVACIHQCCLVLSGKSVGETKRKPIRFSHYTPNFWRRDRAMAHVVGWSGGGVAAAAANCPVWATTLEVRVLKNGWFLLGNILWKWMMTRILPWPWKSHI